ncbi:putative Acylphosphate phosphohydrolase [Paramagnetospirillum magnetotacticum MS-1]|uniref:Acylphosphatase n=1 Tax=Paramagnetospirillum magnetotacticum MS-1 TaxID=272627 RepID=A0A0C2YEM1_PARME|nr:acylphosphatase [Paramagnetospirillum magnetotacticum]KIL98139.1 putative Acylphosphate phosphohydrolase [Paramagnetospirillum magnetotacticum MS-1]
MTGETSIRVLIEGRVQGVWFRGWTVEQATSRKLSGWVRNLVDGRVEALFHGPSHLVRDMVEACHKGPPAALVTRVETEASSEHPSPGFHQRPTA